jgi:hypothetical protein
VYHKKNTSQCSQFLSHDSYQKLSKCMTEMSLHHTYSTRNVEHCLNVDVQCATLAFKVEPF